MKTIVFTLIALLSVESSATEVGFFTNSYHYKNQGTLNENNPGLYITTKNDYQAGFFKNSYGDQTIFAGKILSTDNKYINLRLSYGLMWGYGWSQHQLADAKLHGTVLLPYLVPMITIQYNNYRINTQFTMDAMSFTYSYQF